jgi:[ribosomal protein S5]-alanine N-acetyltransferase
MLRLIGERVALRDYGSDDLQAFADWETDPEVMKYASWISPSLAETRRHLKDAIEQSRRPNRERYFLALELNSTRKVIGGAGITILKQNEFGGIAELGYFLKKLYWGCGYATEAARMLISFAFSQTAVHKVIAECNRDNKASERVMQKCGMVKESELRSGRLEKGHWCDGVMYGLLKDEWTGKASQDS